MAYQVLLLSLIVSIFPVTGLYAGGSHYDNNIVEAPGKAAQLLAFNDREKRKKPKKKRDQKLKPGKAYSKYFSARGGFSQSSSQSKSEFGDGVKSTDTKLEASVTFAWKVSRFFIGPLFSYSSSKSTTEGLDTSSESSSMQIGGIIDYIIGDLESGGLLPNIYAGGRYITRSEGADSDVKPSGYVLGVGAGFYYFLARNIALAPSGEFKIQKTSYSSSDTKINIDTTAFSLLFGITAFL